MDQIRPNSWRVLTSIDVNGISARIYPTCFRDFLRQHCDDKRSQHGQCYMPASDDRNSREHLSLELPLRFLRHETRTQLSGDFIFNVWLFMAALLATAAVMLILP